MTKQALLIASLTLLLASGTLMEGSEVDAGNGLSAVPAAGFAGAAAVESPVRLTVGGCCTQPFWSPDGKQVRYIDKPAGGKLGIYGVTAAGPEAQPVLVSPLVEDSRIVGPYRIETTAKTTALVRLSDGKKFNVPAQGRTVHFSPDFVRIAWSVSNQDLPAEQQVAVIWVANVDGTNAKRVATLRRGGVGGWISNTALLVNGEDPKDKGVQVLWSLSVADGKLREIARGERLRSALLSPSGKWIAYYTTFNQDSQNGLWLVDTSVGKPKAAPKGSFGAYQWRTAGGEDQLVIVPFKPEATYHEFWQLDPESLEFKQLTQAEQAPVKIANGDWRVSPDGRYVAFVESKDRNIWVLELP